MKLQFRPEPLLRMRGIPLRYFYLLLSLLLFVVYIVMGIPSDNLIPQTGVVKEARMGVVNKAGILRFDFELIDSQDTLFWQDYYIDIPARIVWSIDQKKLMNLHLQPNDTITFFYDKEGQLEETKTGSKAVKTYGLTVNGEELIDVTKRKYLTFGVGIVGSLSFLSLVLSFINFILDISISSRFKKKKSSKGSEK